jgi:CRISPR-associated exonuclease Cas4
MKRSSRILKITIIFYNGWVLMTKIGLFKYYLWILEQNGVIGAKGVLEYPKQRHTEGVELTDEDRVQIPDWIAGIETLAAQETCPKVIDKPVCKNCSYFKYCYAA